MRVRLTLEVPDAARRYLARLLPEAPHTREGRHRKLLRAALIEHLQGYVNQLAEDFSGGYVGPLSDKDQRDAQDAVSYLRAAGKSDGQIRAWLLLQRSQAMPRTVTRDID